MRIGLIPEKRSVADEQEHVLKRSSEDVDVAEYFPLTCMTDFEKKYNGLARGKSLRMTVYLQQFGGSHILWTLVFLLPSLFLFLVLMF